MSSSVQARVRLAGSKNYLLKRMAPIEPEWPGMTTVDPGLPLLTWLTPIVPDWPWLSICLSLCLFVILSVHLSFCLSVHLSICPSVLLSICPSAHLSICPSVYLSICPSVHLSICPAVHLSPECAWPTLHFSLLVLVLCCGMEGITIQSIRLAASDNYTYLHS